MQRIFNADLTALQFITDTDSQRSFKSRHRCATGNVAKCARNMNSIVIEDYGWIIGKFDWTPIHEFAFAESIRQPFGDMERLVLRH